MSRRYLLLCPALLASIVALLAGVPVARAAFGVAPGSFFAKTHPTVPLKEQPGFARIGEEKIIDSQAIESAAPITQAGAHPDATTNFTLRQTVPGTPDDDLKNVRVELPPGFIADPTAVPACPPERFQAMIEHSTGPVGCPPTSQVGVGTIYPSVFINTPQTSPIYRLPATFGHPASFAFIALGKPVLLDARLRSDDDYGVEVEARAAYDQFLLRGSTLTFWGVPGDPVHDSERWNQGKFLEERSLGNLVYGDWGAASSRSTRPFLSNPTDCLSGPLPTSLSLDSWEAPGDFLPASPGDPDYTSYSPQPTGCGELAFGGPSAPAAFSLVPSEPQADTPSAYAARLTLPYDENAEGLADPTLRDTTVTLPEGVTVNPSSANGLAACSEGQIGLLGTGFPMPNPIHFDEAPIGCPDASKIGTVTIDTPLLEKPLTGSVYLAAQEENPFGSLLAIYLAIEDPETGIVVKLAGKVVPDPSTGRLTASFTDNPQLPFTELDLDFFGGPGAPLVNPQTCGQKTTTAQLTPWSAPETPSVSTSDSFTVSVGAGGGACPASEAAEPNHPSLSVGTTGTQAGSYSPFVLKLGREDGSQRLGALDLTLPPGLTGRLAGIPYCAPADIAAAEAESGMAESRAPSCPAASRVGRVDVAVGAGPTPFHAAGDVYLAGPYEGAPLSLAIITPALAGPFDLGTVVVRTALQVDPATAQITAVSGPLPSILRGVPLDIRSVALTLDRPDFTRNPASCEEMAFAGQAISTLGATAPLSQRFQVGGCGHLRFKPRLALMLLGKTDRNAKPRLRAVLTAKPGEAGIARARVNLPHSEFLEQAHIRTVCTRVQFAAGNGHGEECPKGSIYGHAKAITPLLDKPLEGPVYLRSSSHKLPDLVAALNGQIDIDLDGTVDSGPNAGIRNTFEVVPDAPVTRFVLELDGGKKGLLVNSEDLCSKTGRSRRAIVSFTGQNGKVESLRPRVRNNCGRG
jgi:hypothetical protein